MNNYQVPPSLAQFVKDYPGLDYDAVPDEIFLYHGTNCYRRWEMNRSGFMEPGRSNYSFFCTRPADAFRYARAACTRDMSISVNSLICEPVVLKVRFNARTWLQVDFVQDIQFGDDEAAAVSVAVLGPVPFQNIVDILHCTHGRHLGGESIRTFEDGTFLTSIQHLRDNLCRKRADAWVLQKLGIFTQKVNTKLAGGEMPDLTSEDNLRRLRQHQIS
jgi:hypothetical protein